MNLKNRINREEIMIRKKQISMFRKWLFYTFVTSS